MISKYLISCNCGGIKKLNQLYYGIYHQFSTASEVNQDNIPVIRIPKYLKTNLGNAIYKEHSKTSKVHERKRKQTNLNQDHINKLIISSSGNKKLNHYYGFRYDPKNVPLISRNWLKHASNGETMIFHRFDANPSLLESLKDEDKSFSSLGLNPNIVSSIYGLVNKGLNLLPSTIQFGVIPLILKNKNVVFSAETGSGKTIAYLAPIIQMIEEKKRLQPRDKHMKSPFGLVILPSRELTEQVGRVAMQLAAGTDVGVATMIGGLPKNITHTGLDLVVSTIGIVESHINKRIYKINQLDHIVLDEADTLLDDTFSFETVDLLEHLNINSNSEKIYYSEKDERVSTGTQLICASATMPTNIDSVIGPMVNMEKDVEKVTTQHLHTIHPNVKHIFYRTDKYSKDLKLVELLKEDIYKKRPTLIFTNRTNSSCWLYNFLNENDINCRRLASDMSEEERLHSFRMFQNEECDILVSTDLGSRGLDTTRVQHVINFDCPHYVSDYIHRAGRTGRLGSRDNCLVSTLVSFKPDMFMLMDLEKSLRLTREIESANANIKSQISQRRADKWDKLQRNKKD